MDELIQLKNELSKTLVDIEDKRLLDVKVTRKAREGIVIICNLYEKLLQAENAPEASYLDMKDELDEIVKYVKENKQTQKIKIKPKHGIIDNQIGFCLHKNASTILLLESKSCLVFDSCKSDDRTNHCFIASVYDYKYGFNSYYGLYKAYDIVTNYLYKSQTGVKGEYYECVRRKTKDELNYFVMMQSNAIFQSAPITRNEWENFSKENEKKLRLIIHLNINFDSCTSKCRENDSCALFKYSLNNHVEHNCLLYTLSLVGPDPDKVECSVENGDKFLCQIHAKKYVVEKEEKKDNESSLWGIWVFFGLIALTAVIVPLVIRKRFKTNS